MKKTLKWIAIIVASAYLAALAALYVEQRDFLYLNDVAQGSPADAGFPEASVMRLSTIDDERIIAWYVGPAPGKMLALYFHGNGGSLRRRGYMLRALTADGMGVLAIDYRGFGGSSGSSTEQGLGLDADAAYDKARALGFTPNEILLVGESLGTGVAVGLASRRDVAGMVLDAPYSSTLDVATARFWMFPVSQLMRDRFHSDELIQKARAPILMMHGEADRTIPFRFGEKLFSLAPEPKEFLRVPGAGHLVLTHPEGLTRLADWTARLGRGELR